MQPVAIGISSAANVRFGSEADIEAHQTHVRFTPKSGHRNSIEKCPLSANPSRSFTRSLRQQWQAATPPASTRPESYATTCRSSLRLQKSYPRSIASAAAVWIRCSRKKRSISRVASGPRRSVKEPAGLPPDHAWPAPWICQCSKIARPFGSVWIVRV
jgi:hypothetical protein